MNFSPSSVEDKTHTQVDMKYLICDSIVKTEPENCLDSSLVSSEQSNLGGLHETSNNHIESLVEKVPTEETLASEYILKFCFIIEII